jgi:hypothetical protein
LPANGDHEERKRVLEAVNVEFEVPRRLLPSTEAEILKLTKKASFEPMAAALLLTIQDKLKILGIRKS